MLVWLLCCLTLTTGTLSQANYKGDKVVRVLPDSFADFKQLRRVLQLNIHRDTWREPTQLQEPLDIHVTGSDLPRLQRELKERKLRHDVIVEDVHRLIKDSNRRTRSNVDMFSTFHNLHDLQAALESVVEQCAPGLRCQLVSIGNSFEGRPLLVVKLTAEGGGERQAVWLDAGIHAREWIAPATALYIIQQLISGYGQDDVVTSLLTEYEWVIMPVLNPDGYHYTWTSDRLWRKTRSTNASTSCVGVDANRNYGFQWRTVGYSTDPCGHLFPGNSPFSEAETAAMAAYMLRTPRRWAIYLSLHSYSQLWMAPWGYTSTPPANYQDLMAAGQVAIDALHRVHGTNYTVGSASNILYPTSGTSRDWAAGALNIDYVYTVEMRDTGRHGFMLPVDQIRPTVTETWAGVLALAEYVQQHTTSGR